MGLNNDTRESGPNRLERDTAAYFDEMTEEEIVEENSLASALVASARTFDVDNEP
jgi:hypothetical protein